MSTESPESPATHFHSHTAEEFKANAATHGIREWRMHDCSLCGYECGFLFRDGEVYYDPGCMCMGGAIERRSWEDVAAHYSIQSSSSVLKEYDAFWHFSTPPNGTI